VRFNGDTIVEVRAHVDSMMVAYTSSATKVYEIEPPPPLLATPPTWTLATASTSALVSLLADLVARRRFIVRAEP